MGFMCFFMKHSSSVLDRSRYYLTASLKKVVILFCSFIIIMIINDHYHQSHL